MSKVESAAFAETGFGVALRESESFEEPSPSSDSDCLILFWSSGGRLKFDSSLGNGSGSRSSRAFKLYIVLRCFQIWSLLILRFNFLLKRSTMQTMKKCYKQDNLYFVRCQPRMQNSLCWCPQDVIRAKPKIATNKEFLLVNVWVHQQESGKLIT